MITKWTVSNFKSITKETSLDLAPLTIFAGPNSSGKSTVLQGMLLISQTLSNKVSSRSVVLNGALTRLGQFDDLRSQGGEYDQITLGWECKIPEAAQRNALMHGNVSSSWFFSGPGSERIREISCKLSFDADQGSPDRDVFQLQPQLFLFAMSVLARTHDNTDQRSELTITRSLDVGAKAADLNITEPRNLIARASLNYDVTLDDRLLENLHEDHATAEPLGCVLQHFLPERLFVRVDTADEDAREITSIVKSSRILVHDRESFAPEESRNRLQDHLIRDLFMNKYRTIQSADVAALVQELANQIWDLEPEQIDQLPTEPAERCKLRAAMADLLRSELPSEVSKYRLISLRLPPEISNASTYLSEFFSNSVKYLGPLRDEPKPLYPLAMQADPTDVGLRGEMTAAVLNLNRDRIIRYIPSAAFDRSPFNPTPVPRSLEAAVTDWLKYLGVAETVYSVDKGKLGHELKVALAKGGPRQDLTHVGVGVSQVLPILVMSLLADQDTTLIFEQPELHLHPMVQTRLGDFFLSISLAGKQCLIETHSEYLINRLRYRAAAEGEGNRVTDSMKIYFVEKPGDTSIFREVTVNEYGAILDWPDGFFDQSQFEAESILRAAAAKRKIRKGK